MTAAALKRKGFAQRDANASTVFECGGVSIGFDESGTITTLREAPHITVQDGEPGAPDAPPVVWDWAGGVGDPSHSIGRYVYQTFTDDDYHTFLHDFSRYVSARWIQLPCSNTSCSLRCPCHSPVFMAVRCRALALQSHW
jgi:hypothetical protein